MTKLTYLLTLLCLVGVFSAKAQNLSTPFELSQEQASATYDEALAHYTALTNQFDFIKIQQGGLTDIGLPLQTVIFSISKEFEAETLRKQGKNILLINNAIHAGEPDGVDACMLLLRDLALNLQDPNKASQTQQLLQNTVIVVIPAYNIDGMLNRGSYSRVNQNGPLAYGFRGNARNLDLNRDFIKCDSENAKSFAKIYHTWQPDVYIENHVTNGADYQYVITYLATQHNKLGGVLGEFLEQELSPSLEEKMKALDFEMSPYVSMAKSVPDSGLVQFLETPRFSSGYVALFHTMGFIVETHMLKPFAQRVKGTYAFMMSMLAELQEKGNQIRALRQQTFTSTQTQTNFPIQWITNREKFKTLQFRGYEAKYKPSAISGLPRLYYDRNEPFTKPVPFYNQYEPAIEVTRPKAYLIPQAWREVIARLELNGVRVQRISEKSVVEAEVYYIQDYKTAQNPFEGHYLHSNTQVSKTTQSLQVYPGDVIVICDQVQNRYIIETLRSEEHTPELQSHKHLV
ncbi:MAG TPA: hypothetical protein DCM08_04950, partial [Microscillaceae bacterium]|nr:hypothetical protein [Microscillaceae bacterium]